MESKKHDMITPLKFNNKYELIIAIDPDNNMSGVAVVNTASGKITTKKMSIETLMIFLEVMKEEQKKPQGKTFKIVIEAGWLIQGNWHLGLNKYMSANRAAAIGRSVGMNHQTGIIIEQICRDYFKLPTELQMPLKKCWSGADGKITQEELEQVTGHPKLPRMNQDMRDAVLIAWEHSGLPMRAVTIKNKSTKATTKNNKMTLEEYLKAFKRHAKHQE